MMNRNDFRLPVFARNLAAAVPGPALSVIDARCVWARLMATGVPDTPPRVGETVK
jgi:hypothetical protein